MTTRVRMDFVDITARLAEAVKASGVRDGVLHIYNPHTTAGVTINEGADPDVERDILAVLQEIVPAKFPYRHAEGNSPAHVMTSLVGSSAAVFINDGKLELGTWQKVFFCEFDGPRKRRLRWRILN
ncbi:MAG: secondary thiamine-phosphate synthase enzyme YjbQ [Deltaproteobacteria bacterium]